jgi:hypothetical protein
MMDKINWTRVKRFLKTLDEDMLRDFMAGHLSLDPEDWMPFGVPFDLVEAKYAREALDTLPKNNVAP